MTPTASTELRDRLRTVRDQMRALREERTEARKARDRAREAFVNGGGTPDTSSPEFVAAEAAVQRVADVERRLDLMRQAESNLLQVLAGSNAESPAYSFLADPEKTETLVQMATSSTRLPTMAQGGVALGQYLSREEMAGRIGWALDAPQFRAALDDTDAPSLREGRHRGIVPSLRLVRRFLDLMPSVPVESKSYDYVQEIPGANAAAETAEGAVKPQASVTYEARTATVKTIAEFIKLNRQQLADISDLNNRLRNHLTNDVLDRLEGQVIAGDGAGENIFGILNTGGIGSIAFDAAELAADQVLDGIAAVLLSGAFPNVVAIPVMDWVAMLKAKTEGTGEYIGAGPFAATANILWGTTTVPVPNLAAGQALVGDTTVGGRVLVREGVNVVAGQEQDDLTRNRVTLLGEGRYGLTVEQPAAFAVVELDGPVS